MIKSISLYFSMVFLFALTQIGMPALTISHLVSCHETQHQDQQHQDQDDTEHHCEQCLSLSHAADASLSKVFHGAVVTFSSMLVEAFPTDIDKPHFVSCSVRAPPVYSLV